MSTNSPEVTTESIGRAIAAFMHEQECSDASESDPEYCIETIDAENENNLVFTLDNGQQFIVRIIAGAA